ncbi:MAG: hypothetical protein GQ561_01245 [Calditrichae bacterium]|nr:hypothetical protein [Calditrichia bacterium]
MGICVNSTCPQYEIPSPIHLDFQGITSQLFKFIFYNPLVPIIQLFFLDTLGLFWDVFQLADLNKTHLNFSNWIVMLTSGIQLDLFGGF